MENQEDNTQPVSAEKTEQQQPQTQPETEQDDIVIEDDAPEQPKAIKPANGYELVDLPEEIKPRFNRLYGQMKAQDRKLAQYEHDLSAAAEHIQKLTDAVNQMAAQTNNNNYQKAEDEVIAKITEAKSRGDDHAEARLLKQLNEITTERKLREMQETALRQQLEQQKSALPRNASAAAAQAYQNKEISYEEKNYIDEWQNETDDNGNQLRPWAFAGHPQYNQALQYASVIFNDPYFADKSIEDKMSELDKRLGSVKQRAQPMPQNPGAAAPRGAVGSIKQSHVIRLTDAQKKIAVALKAGGPSAKNNDDHIKAYARSFAQISNKKGK